MLVKCICTYCAGHLEFEEENAGEKIKCPHCGFETTLFLPGNEPDEELAPRKATGLRGKRPLILAAAAVLVLGALGYSLYRWVLPPLKDWLPFTDSPVLPVLVLGIALLLVFLVLAWVLFPVLIYFQLRRMTEVLAGIQVALRPVLSAEPIIDEEEIVEESTPDLEPSAAVSESRENAADK
jgi:hypothetical protein